ncbi:hypothetical protein J4447_01635 [Candidatus Pacearchaeota archaeon]|nr:hypothetical protein [Candidatus Pacearchaeota archaeon]
MTTISREDGEKGFWEPEGDFQKEYEELIKATGGKFRLGFYDLYRGQITLEHRAGGIILMCPDHIDMLRHASAEIYCDIRESSGTASFLEDLKRFVLRVEKLSRMGYKASCKLGSGKIFAEYDMFKEFTLGERDRASSIEKLLRDFGEIE